MSALVNMFMVVAICLILAWLLMWPANWYLWRRRGADGVTPVERWAIRGAYRKTYGSEPSDDEVLRMAMEIREREAT